MPSSPPLERAVYERAEKLLTLNRSQLAAGGQVKPRWIGKGERFWYRREGPTGHSFVLVDPARRLRMPAFDHERLAQGLEQASGSPVSATSLPFASIKLVEGTAEPADAVEFDALGTHWRCRLDTYACEKVTNHVAPDPLEVRSPDGKWAIALRDHNLCIRELRTGEERALTSDGVSERSYGTRPDCLSFGVLARQYGLPHFPPIVAWSPDSRRVLTHSTDQRGVRLQYLLEAVPPDGGLPALHTYRYAIPGDEIVPRAELMVFDVESGAAVPAKTDPLVMTVISPISYGRVWWSEDGDAIYILRQSRDLKCLQLQRMHPTTGQVRPLVEERGEPWVEPNQYTGGKPIVRVLSNHHEALWYSERNGWGHLYLYDLESGQMRCQLTSGEWGVREILHVDEKERIVYFVAAGLIESDPYRRQVCRVNLDGTSFARLSLDDLDHVLTVPENKGYYIDTASAVDTVPIISVRDWNGELLVELERADVSVLLETGWTPPERFRVKAADGQTDIYGVLHRPHGFDPEKRYPVIDHPYPGPQINRVNPGFGELNPLYDPESLASLGFVVVAVDGRGTPGRSRAFHEISYRNYDKAGFLEDHVAALRQLAKIRPWMDLERGVGIHGASGGGYATLRAMCAYPDFYTVGVSICGNHDQLLYQVCWGEPYLGLPTEAREAYLKASNVEIVDRLEGKLLLIHGEMDDNVHPHLTLRVVDRLIKANKDFELLLVPGAEHLFLGYLPYITRRKWDFFVRHLLGAEPPANFRLADTRPSFDALFG